MLLLLIVFACMILFYLFLKELLSSTHFAASVGRSWHRLIFPIRVHHLLGICYGNAEVGDSSIVLILLTICSLHFLPPLKLIEEVLSIAILPLSF